MSGTLFVVATPIGNLEDITARALRVLREVDVIAAEDTRRTAGLLAHFGIDTPTTSLHEHNEGRKSVHLVRRLQQGENVALVSDAGTPLVSDPGGHLVRAAVAAGIAVDPIPGPSAALATLSVSGFPADSFTFLGFPPTRPSDRKQWIARLAASTGSVVFYEAPHRIRETLGSILAAVGDRPVVLARELTKAHQELVRGPISVVAEGLASPKGEFTVVIFLGDSPQIGRAEAPSDADLLTEFGQLTQTAGLRRRQAISALARRHAQAPNDVYEAIERAKKLVKQ